MSAASHKSPLHFPTLRPDPMALSETFRRKQNPSRRAAGVMATGAAGDVPNIWDQIGGGSRNSIVFSASFPESF